MLVRFLAASVVGGIVFFVLGFLIYGQLLEERVMKPNMAVFPGLIKETPNFVLVFLANVVLAMLLAYIFEKLAGIRTFVGGLKSGAVVWFFTALSFQLLFAGFWNLHLNYIPLVADVIGSTVMGALGGGVIAQVLGMMNKSAASE